ncbi:MAG TPA: tRNA pseudouridine(55) synthase TruB [Haliangium sp.]|nr:tRNA pseudouridine(55) synthase TruB [Haliangium sp.]
MPRAPREEDRPAAERDLTALDGVLVVDKPAGMTSAHVVARVKRALRARRIGHTGTLDPMATGVLPLCLGEATKIAGYLLAEDKAYEAELLLGVETDTLDAEGAVTARDPDGAAAVTEAAVREVMAGFVGPGVQVPPMFSALKHQGKRLHELARAGESVDRPPRPIVIHELTVRELALPRVRFFVHCSKGTYVRSLVADVGRALGCGAHLTALRRTRSGGFGLDRALDLAELGPEAARRALIAPAEALAHVPAVTVPPERERDVATGKLLPWTALGLAGPPVADGPMRLVDAGGRLLALVTADPAPIPSSIATSITAANTASDLTPGRASGSLRYLRVFTYDLTNRATSSNLSGSSGRGTSRPERHGR